MDDASEESTKKIVENCISRISYDLKYIKMKKQVGLPSARNVGIKNSNYEFIGFLDDDCIPIRKDLIKRACRWLLSRNQKIVGVGGPIYFRSTEPYKVSSLKFKDFLKFKKFFKLFVKRIDNYFFNRQKLMFVDVIPGGNSFFKKKYIELCNGYNPSYDGNFYAEETDFCLKIRKFGNLISDPKMPVNHLQVSYGGCRQKIEIYYQNLFSNIILLILNHKRIYFEVLIDIFRHIFYVFKMILIGMDNDSQKINKIRLVKLLIYSIVDGIKKYYFQNKNHFQILIEESIEFNHSI